MLNFVHDFQGKAALSADYAKGAIFSVWWAGDHRIVEWSGLGRTL